MTLRIAGERELEISHDKKRENALATLERFARPLPEGFKFNREELYERGKDESS